MNFTEVANFFAELFSMLNEIDPFLSIIGAAAWIPAILQYVESNKEKQKLADRKIEMSVFDFAITTNVCKKNFQGDLIYGSLLVLAVNLYVPDKSFFAKNSHICIKFRESNPRYAYIVDGNFEMCNGKITRHLPIEQEYNFNLHREIIHDKDNLRTIAIFIPDKEISCCNRIDEIIFTLSDEKNDKTIVLTKADFPIINNSTFLDEIRKTLELLSANK